MGKSSNSKRLKIGLLVSHLEDFHTKEICRGATIAAKEMNIDMIIIPGRYLDPPSHNHLNDVLSSNYSGVFLLARELGLDGLVVSAGTIACHIDSEKLEKFLQCFDGIPMVTIAVKTAGRPCVSVSAQEGVRDALEHFIKVHDAKKIAFISGPKGNADAEMRLAVYKNTLIKNGISFDPSLVHYGTFARHRQMSLEHFLDKNIDNADAFFFANDEMAAAGLDYAEKHGILAGQDMLIAGYDDIPAAASFSPALSTVRADPSHLGYYGIKLMLDALSGNPAKDIVLPSKFIVRESCGCTPSDWVTTTERDPMKLADMFANELMDIYAGSPVASGNISEFRNTLVEFFTVFGRPGAQGLTHALIRKICIGLTETDRLFPIPVPRMSELCTKLFAMAEKVTADERSAYSLLQAKGEAMRIVSKRAAHIEYELNNKRLNMLVFSNSMLQDFSKSRYSDIYEDVFGELSIANISSSRLYIYPKPCESNSFWTWKYPDSMQLCVAFGKRFNIQLDSTRLVPLRYIFKEMCDNRTEGETIAVLTPIVHSNVHYGFLITEADFNEFYYIQDVTVKLSSSLRITSLIDKLNQQLEELNNAADTMRLISVTDDLTRLYNRRGFYECAGELAHSSENIGRRAAIFYGDLDNLKTTNDHYGHSIGDDALRAAGKSLSIPRSAPTVSARVGGDEFAMFTLLDDNETADDVLRSIENFQKEYNKISNQPYDLEMSIGYCEFLCSPSVSLTTQLTLADRKQYENKEKRKAAKK